MTGHPASEFETQLEKGTDKSYIYTLKTKVYHASSLQLFITRGQHAAARRPVPA